MQKFLLLFLAGFACQLLAQPAPAQAADAKYKLTVSAGAVDRRNSVATFDFPEKGGRWQLTDSQGRSAPLQVDPAGKASFILAHLQAGSNATFQVSPAQSEDAPAVQSEKKDGAVLFRVHGKPVIQYQAEKSELPRPNIKPAFQRGGYIHPVFTPTGKIVTDDYPPDHIHHHGIWMPWTKTEFEGRKPDFWNMGAGTGTVEFVDLDKIWEGPVHGGFVARHRFVDLTAPSPKAALNEAWEVRVYRVGDGSAPFWMFDLVSRQQCASDSPLILPKYHYGGLGFRGHGQWNGATNCNFLTSEGITDRVKGNETRGRWCHVGGKIDGQLAGAAILCHPDNYRAPQPMRLHPKEPFFCYAPQQLGDMEVAPGQTYTSRYRFIVADGAPDKQELERFWQDYANPVKVEISRQ